jgi:hypothetical protein
VEFGSQTYRAPVCMRPNEAVELTPSSVAAFPVPGQKRNVETYVQYGRCSAAQSRIDPNLPADINPP